MEKIEYSSFDYTKEVRSIVLPESVKSVEWRAFGSWQKLQTIYLPTRIENIHKDAFLRANSYAVMQVEDGSYAHDFAVSNKK